jgi:transcription elongation GreA/GreB family factor
MNSGTVGVGSWVTVQDGEQEEAWGVVDPAEADLGKRLISREAPLARALLGHGPGDVVRVQTPYGTRDVTVLGVEELAGSR